MSDSPSQGSEPAVRIEGLNFDYGGRPILQGVDLILKQGDLVCVVGPNGGGKTTLIKLILGLLKPASGKVRVLGGSPRGMCRYLGYVPQYGAFDPLFPIRTIDIVLMGRLGGRLVGPYSRRDRQAALAALDEMELGGEARESFANLSGGQRQRVLIARALACEPRILLLDEPMANVDLTVEERFFDLLKQLSSRMTIVLVSHDLGLVSKMVRQVVCVNRRVHVHPTSELTGETIREIYGRDAQFVHHHHDIGGNG